VVDGAPPVNHDPAMRRRMAMGAPRRILRLLA
jgi:hypothetical protein